MIPSKVQTHLNSASKLPRIASSFQCDIFNDPWDRFIEAWASKAYSFVAAALGPYGTTPLPRILKLDDGFHAAGANASFDLDSGQVRLARIVHNNPGMTLEKITHEFVHGALSQFPQEDVFYDEGFVDYSTFVLAHAPIWGEHQKAMLASATENIRIRGERARLDQSDYDRKRWTGGLFAAQVRGPWIIMTLRQKKMEKDFRW